MIRRLAARLLTRWAEAHHPLPDITDPVADAADAVCADQTRLATLLNAWEWDGGSR